MSMQIGTRGSALALWQANAVLRALGEHFPDFAADLVEVKTTGDRVTDRALFALGGMGVFTKELEEKLLDGSIDMAVHSLKDLPTAQPPGLKIGAVLPRGAPWDALVTRDGCPLLAMASKAKIGTSSLRRRAQIRALRPDLTLVDVRGNLDTRLKKLAEGRMDGLVAARAGLDRLGVDPTRFIVEDLKESVPAPAQGTVAVEVRADREDLHPVLDAIHHRETETYVLAERAFLAALGGGCHVPIGALASSKGGKVHLTGWVAAVEGSRALRGEAESQGEPEILGKSLARDLLDRGAREILDAFEPP
ncbi:MAG: hydroxymethylbilane synthase [Planctomycetota bacterium]|jgi:hydroxymethylbilane synthase